MKNVVGFYPSTSFLSTGLIPFTVNNEGTCPFGKCGISAGMPVKRPLPNGSFNVNRGHFYPINPEEFQSRIISKLRRSFQCNGNFTIDSFFENIVNIIPRCNDITFNFSRVNCLTRQTRSEEQKKELSIRQFPNLIDACSARSLFVLSHSVLLNVNERAYKM